MAGATVVLFVAPPAQRLAVECSHGCVFSSYEGARMRHAYAVAAIARFLLVTASAVLDRRQIDLADDHSPTVTNGVRRVSDVTGAALQRCRHCIVAAQACRHGYRSRRHPMHADRVTVLTRHTCFERLCVRHDDPDLIDSDHLVQRISVTIIAARRRDRTAIPRDTFLGSCNDVKYALHRVGDQT